MIAANIKAIGNDKAGQMACVNVPAIKTVKIDKNMAIDKIEDKFFDKLRAD
ncbi:hypothetical protein LOOC260_119910 [Paucilactobacillus hokkaidonensis JCM 18461]|uniref:Uncharacterized protein n=1 Tax=Paucilactobacillus hokkaidonensis JCM 18461 TaxID=1291742 RepID=A0A0A1GW59_9LACO|nr:hypothetical protein LOOC260_119910 [Paucilactobacillus hokkaidonensis JCM 18461]